MAVRFVATPWARKAMTDEDRRAIEEATPAGALVTLLCKHPPRPATGSAPARPGVYLAQITRWPDAWHGDGDSPIEAFSRALVKVPPEPVA